MSVTMPKIEIKFKQLASSFVLRSERGTAILIVRDETENSLSDIVKYTDAAAADLDKAFYTETNILYIKDALSFKANEVYVVRINNQEPLNTALTAIKNKIPTGWITVAGGSTEDLMLLKSWIISQENGGDTYKAVCYKLTAPDSMHIVNFINDKVTFADDRGEVTGEKYLASLVGMLAGCNVEQGCTNYVCSNLSAVEEVEDRDASLDSGGFILYNDDDYVKVGRGINSLVTFDGVNKTEDMRYIDIVEAIDLIRDDISATWHDDYCGNYKNLYDNQILFISAVNGYYRDLASEYVLDRNYSNVCDVDVDAQRLAWISSGKSEASGWDEAKVKNMTFKRKVFLKSEVKILGAMEDLSFTVNIA